MQIVELETGRRRRRALDQQWRDATAGLITLHDLDVVPDR